MTPETSSSGFILSKKHPILHINIVYNKTYYIFMRNTIGLTPSIDLDRLCRDLVEYQHYGFILKSAKPYYPYDTAESRPYLDITFKFEVDGITIFAVYAEYDVSSGPAKKTIKWTIPSEIENTFPAKKMRQILESALNKGGDLEIISS